MYGLKLFIMSKLIIDKRKEWIGKEVTFTVKIDDELLGELKPNKHKLILDVPEGIHTLSVFHGKRTIFKEKIDLKGSKSFILRSFIKNLKKHNFFLWLNNISLLIFFIFGHIEYIRYLNYIVFIVCLPHICKTLYYVFFNRSKYFQLEEVNDQQFNESKKYTVNLAK